MMLAAQLTAGQTGVRLVAFFFVMVFFAAAALDLWWEFRGKPGMARRLQEWAGHHRMLAAGMAALVGALIGHFYFWAPLFH